MAVADFGKADGRILPVEGERRVELAEATRIPQDIRDRLDGDQVMRLAELLARADPARHRVAYRVSSRLLGKRFYVALFAGIEKRCPGRVKDAGEKRWLLRLMMDAALFGWALLCAVAFVLGFAVVGAYLLKSGMGIDLFEDHFILHDLFFD